MMNFLLSPSCTLRLSALGAFTFCLLASTHAAELSATDGAPFDLFGNAVSLSGGLGLIGAYGDNLGGTTAQGSAYVFRNLDTATTGDLGQNAKLIASDGAGFSNFSFAYSVGISGNIGLIGAYGDDHQGSGSGSAYVYRDLDTVTGTVTQNAKLIASDERTGYAFGQKVSISGNMGMVAAYGATISQNSQGAIYIYRNLDTVTGTVTENAKLIASDATVSADLGSSVSLAGNIGLVGDSFKSVNGKTWQGGAYLYRNLDTVTGTATENAQLIASDGAANDNFGNSVSIFGQLGLVGSSHADIGGNADQGAVYVYRNLDTVTGTVTENAKLIASDGAASSTFGSSVSLFDSTALVGAPLAKVDGKNSQGAVYLYRNLDTATGTAIQDVKLLASDGVAGDFFGQSVSVDGDLFLIGANRTNSFRGSAYTGSVSSVTTLDDGNASREISGISFISQDDWIIGQSTDRNQVSLDAGNSANVMASGKSIFIGQNAGADHNTLIVSGQLTANTVYIGSVAGNEGNTLQIDSTASFAPITLRLASENLLKIQGDYTDLDNLLTYLGASALQVWGEGWVTIDAGNASELISSSFSNGYTTIQAIPEPSTWGMLLLGAFVIEISRRLRISQEKPRRGI